MGELAQTKQQAAADAAFGAHKRVAAAVRTVRVAWVDLARELHGFHAGRLWEALGLDSFESWLAQPEIGLSRRWVYQLIQVWQELILDAGVKPNQLEDVEVSKLIVALPAVRRKQVTPARVLADAATLTRGDMLQMYDELKPDVGTDLDAEREPDIVTCHVCGTRVPRTQIGAG